MDAKTKKYSALLLICAALVATFLVAPRLSRAIGACATVTIEIPQELTLERIAFDAKMSITNSIPDKDLTNIRVDVTIKDADGNVKNELFFIRLSSNSNLDAVDGTGVVAAGTKGEAHWLIIPSADSGGSDPAGVAYYVGATLTYSVDGNEEVVPVNPARIVVKPEPQLVLDYFNPYEVLGDNPFTPKVEAPIPFPLAVRVLNEGYGPAKSLKIDSAQPTITANDQGLLVNFRLLGAAVNDSAVSPSLTVSIGTLESKRIATAYWEMISTLTGKFVEFKVSFTHASELGGDLTSLIKATNAHYLIHRVKVNLPGRDNLLDFLATSSTGTASNPDHLPDALYESEIPGNTGNVEDARAPVTVVSVTSAPGHPTSSSPEVQMSVQTGMTGWVYARLSDPAQGLLKILDVVRNDGVHLDPNNFWVQEGVDQNFQKTFTLHLLDYRADANTPGTYKLVFTQPEEDAIPPSTDLIFDGPWSGTNPVYITPQTRIVFLATDNDGGSGVDQMLKKIEGIDAVFAAAYPQNLATSGTYTLDYYSVDRSGNEEAVKTAIIVVDNAAPSITMFQASPSTITPLAPKGVGAPKTTNFSVRATDDQDSLQVTIDIASGATFTQSAIVRTIKTSLTTNATATIPWDGKNSTGSLVPTGAYTARLSVTDGLDSGATTTTSTHTATEMASVTIADWFTGQPLDANLTGAQQHPKVSGTRVVWQDNRSGNWQIYTKATDSVDSSVVTTGAPDHQYPAISGDIIVWQEKNLNGEWDIYGHDLATSMTFSICSDPDCSNPGNQERPVISGDWVAWQDDRNGNWDIYAYNLLTQQTFTTDHVRDQMHPTISGMTLAWEDYRHGLGNIYTYDLASGTESRYTVSSYNQTLPVISDGMLAWTDHRNSQRDIFFSSAQNTETRATYGAGDHSQATMLGGVIVYTDYEAGLSDPNLSFYDTSSGLGALLMGSPARQEEPSLGTDVLVWQDDRDGIAQIYWSSFQVETLPIAIELKPGLNLIAVGDKLATAYPTTSSLIAANPNNIAINKIVAYSSQNSLYMDTSTGTDIALQKGMAIGLYASTGGSLDIADSGETGLYTLLPDTNYVGILTVPNGYTAYNMLASIGFDNVQSVRRFDNQTGLWESASVRDVAGTKAAAGANFALRQGDGVIVVMKMRVDGWKP